MKTESTFEDGWSNGPAPESANAIKTTPRKRREGKSAVKLGKGLLG